MLITVLGVIDVLNNSIITANFLIIVSADGIINLFSACLVYTLSTPLILLDRVCG